MAIAAVLLNLVVVENIAFIRFYGYFCNHSAQWQIVQG